VERAERFWNPYLAGLALGLVLLTSFLVTGKGLGASGAAYHLGLAAVEAAAPEHVAQNPYFAAASGDGWASHFNHRLIFMVLGVVLGGLVGAASAGRLKAEVVRGPRVGPRTRLALALGGGVLMGVAARLALGCTSGQALSGGALLSAGSWAFMMCIFAGGYAVAWFVRRQWT
jgi:hypothetical protein